MRSLEIVDKKLKHYEEQENDFKQIKQDLEFLKVLIEHLAIVEEQFDVDEFVNILVLNDIDEITNFKIYKKALEYINKYGVKNVGS